MSNTPPVKDDPKPESTGVESRLAVLEESVARINEFNRSVTNALTHALERLNALEPLPAWTSAIEIKIDNYRTVQTLERASKIFPKTRTVTFVSQGYFGGNIKHAFFAFRDYARDKNIAAHFLTDDVRQHDLLKANGLPCLPCDPDDWSLEDIRVLFGTKVIVIANNFHAYSLRNPKAFGMLQGAKTIQLWHGIPVKGIGFRYLVRPDNVLLEELVASSGPFDAFVAPAAAAREEWAQMFAFRKFAAAGYPRNDVFFRDLTAQDRLNTDAEALALFEGAKARGKPVILYTPTFRDDAASGWFDKAGILALDEHARQNDYILAVNLHPYEQAKVEEFRTRYLGVRFVAPLTDIYPLVKYADVLITDYSSLAFDYLLLDRPLIFYRPDHDYYMTKSRGCMPGHEHVTPGAVATNIRELIRAVDAAVNYARAPATDPSRIARHDLRGKLFDRIDGNAGQRVSELIEQMIESEEVI